MGISEIEDKLIELCQEEPTIDPFTGVTLLYSLEVYAAYAYIFNHSVETAEEFSEWRADAEDNYQGEFNSDRSFAESTAGDLGWISSETEWPYTHIDWASAAVELMFDYSDHWGHYFRN